MAILIIAASIPAFAISAIAEIPGYVKEIEHKGTSPEGYTPIFTREDISTYKE